MPNIEDAGKRVQGFFSADGALRIRQIGARMHHGAGQLAKCAGVAAVLMLVSGVPKAMAGAGSPINPASSILSTPSQTAVQAKERAFIDVQRLYDNIHEQVVARTGDCLTPLYLVSGKGRMTGAIVAVNDLFVAIAPTTPGTKAVFVHPLSHIATTAGIKVGDRVMFYMNDVDGLSELYKGEEEPDLRERIRTLKSPQAQALLQPQPRQVDALVKEWKRERLSGREFNTDDQRSAPRGGGFM